MSEKTYSSLGFDFPIAGLPSTVEEFNTAAGRDCCLDYGIQHYVAHNHLSKVRVAICKAVEAATGITRRTEPVDGDSKAVKYSETEQQYTKRADSELPEGESLEVTYLETILEAVASVNVDLTKQVRSGGGSKVAQKWLDKGKAVRESGKLIEFCDAHEIVLPEDADDEAIDILLGNKIRLLMNELQKQAEQQVMGM